tara:strand:+ start:1184 stop:1297 length:114 start_codon:yes stop_codon:yes gene_type:complete
MKKREIIKCDNISIGVLIIIMVLLITLIVKPYLYVEN